MTLRHHVCRPLRFLLLSGSLLLWGLLASSGAQVSTSIRPDGTLGTTVIRNGTVYDITGGRRPGQENGPNLFHSFGRFTVGTGDTARFTGPAGIKNVLSRVTGGVRSDIDGQLQSTIPGANLYLLNPSGVLFGPHATLDIGGAFHVSTADALRLADGATFAARLGAQSTLTVAPPVAFGFLRQQPAGIAIHGSALHVAEGKTVSVVGGDIAIVGLPERSAAGIPTLAAPSGRIQLVSVAAPGAVGPRSPEQTLARHVEAGGRLGTVSISNAALLDVSGAGGGTVAIRGGRLLVDSSFIFADTRGARNGARIGIDFRVTGEIVHTHAGAITTDNLGTGNAGKIRITAGKLQMDHAVLGSRAFAEGHAGDVVVTASTVMLTGGAQISSSTGGPGHGGSVTVRATEAVTLTGTTPDGASPSDISASTAGAGNAGSVLVEAPTVTLTEGAQITSITVGPGHGGSVTIRATEAVTLAGTTPDGVFSSNITASAERTETGAGNAGAVLVEAPTVTLTEGGYIASVTAGPGHGGSVTVRATEAVTLAGTTPDSAFPSGISASSQVLTAGAGNAGAVLVEAPTVTLTGGGQISSGTFGPGQGGSVTVRATEAVTLVGTAPNGTFASGISASTQATGARAGNAGSVLVEAPTVTLTEGGQITSFTTGPGHGGSVTVRATETVTLAGVRITPNGTAASGIFANTEGAETGAGNAGTVLVEAPTVTLTGGGQIASATFGPGQGSSVTVRATQAVTLAGTDPDCACSTGIFADTTSIAPGAGNAGTVLVEAPTVTLTEGGQISSATAGPGHGGTLTLTATDTVALSGRDSGVFVSTTGSGAGGDIVLQAPAIRLAEEASISAEATGTGDAGNVTLRSTETFRSTNGAVTTTATAGQGGVITITAGAAIDLTTTDIAATVTGGTKRGGDITLTTPALTLTGGRLAVETQGAGPAGNITLHVQTLVAQGQATLTSSSTGTAPGAAGTATIQGLEAGTAASTVVLRDSVLLTRAEGNGAGGNIAVRATALTLADGTTISATTAGGGRGGNIALQAHTLQLTEGTVISAESSGTGNAGDITMTTSDSFLSEHSTVTTAASQADGGNITVTAPTLVRLRDSRLTATVGGGPQTVGGNVTIDPQFVLLQNSQVSANAFEGRGGNVQITAEVFLADPASQVSASSALGITGTVDIRAPVTTLSGVVAPLPRDFAAAAAVLRAPCAARLRAGHISSLVVAGRDGVPPEPEGGLPSPLAWTTPEAPAPTETLRPPRRHASRGWGTSACP